MMTFAQPKFLWWLMVLPVLALILHMLFLRKQAKAYQFIENKLWEQKVLTALLWRGRIQAAALLMAVCFSILAMARPQWGESEQTVKRKGLDILVAVDVSKSMLTRDVRPNRLERTQWAIKDLVKKLSGDRIGLMAFAGEAFVMCPLTLDYNGFLMSVDDLSPSVIPRGGTDLSRAIEEALNNYGKGAGNYQTLVLVTDGDELEGDALAAARKAKDKGVKIFTVGVGTKEGDLIEVTDESGGHDFLKDSNGNVVKSRLNENLLQGIAFTTGGAYVRSSPSEFGLDFLYDKQLVLIPKREMESKQSKQMIDRYQWPLSIAFLFLLLPIFFTDIFIKRFILTVVVLLLLPSLSYAQNIRHLVHEGNKAFAQGDFDRSVDQYTQALKHDPESAILNYNLGTALIKTNAYEKSIGPLAKAAQAKDRHLVQQAKYNAGTAMLHAGLLQEDSDLDKAIHFVEQAVSSFEQVLTMNSKDISAKKNLNTAKHELDRLKEKKKNQDKQKKDGQSSDKDQSSSNEDKSKDQQSKQQEQDSQQQKSEDQQQKDSKTKEGKSQEPSDHEKKAQEGQQESSKKDQDKQAAQGKNDKGAKKDDKNKEQAIAQPEENDPNKKQATEMLEDYQRLEEPKGMIYLINKKSNEKPVDKDW